MQHAVTKLWNRGLCVRQALKLLTSARNYLLAMLFSPLSRQFREVLRTLQSLRRMSLEC